MEYSSKCVPAGIVRSATLLCSYSRSGFVGAIIFFLLLLIAAPGQIFAPEPVEWQDLVKTGASYPGSQGSTLTRTGAGTGAWDADAISTKWIYGDGWVEFKFNQTDKAVTVGLASANPNRDWTGLPFAIKGAAAGSAAFFESSTQVGSTIPTFSTTDVFRIERIGTRVTFTRTSSAGTVLNTYTSLTPSQGILFVDTSILNANAGISSCRYFGASSAEDVLWRFRNCVPTYGNGGAGSSITKAPATNAYDADASSQKALWGDGYFRFRFAQTTKILAAGLATQDVDYGYSEMTYAIYVSGTSLQIYEGGTLKYTAPANYYTINDVFTIRRTGGQVTYAKNDTVFYTSLTTNTATLFADVSFYSTGGGITNCQIDGFPLSESPGYYGLSGASISYFPTGGTFQKTNATSAWDTGGITYQGLAAESTGSAISNGEYSFSFGQSSGGAAAAGLSSVHFVSPTLSDVTFAVVGRVDGQVEVVESGVSRGVFGSYQTSDIFSVRRLSTGSGTAVIEYTKNRVLFRSVPISGSNATSALWGAVCIYTTGAKVERANLFTGHGNFFWRQLTRTTADFPSYGYGGRLYRDSSAAGWTADALGSRQLVGDGYVQWYFANPTKDAMVGLSTSDKSAGNGGLDYAIYGNGANGVVKVWLNGGATVTSHGSFTTSDTFRIRRAGNQIRFSKISFAGVETLLTSTTVSPTTPLVLDCSLQDPDVVLNDFRMAWSDNDSDGLDDQWELGEFGNLSQSGTGALGDFDGDGIDNLHEFYDGTDPAETYYTSAPTLTLISGNNQFSDADTFLRQPLVVEVRNPSQPGNPVMANVPVRFYVVSGGGALSAQYGGAQLLNSVGAWTDANGRAKVYYKQPNLNGVGSVIRAQAGGSAAASNVVDFACQTNFFQAWWRFDEASGSAVLDSAPKPTTAPPVILPNNGTITGAIRETSFWSLGGGVVDNALRFDGIDDFVTVLHLPAGAGASTLEFSGAAFSVSAWIRVDSGIDLTNSTTIYPIVSKWAAAGNGFEFAIKGGATAKGITFRTLAGGVTGQEITPSLDQRTKLGDGLPHLVTFTRDASNFGRLYVDGVEVGTLAGMTGGLYTTANLYLGKDGSAAAKFYRGLIEDVKVLTTPLQADEIAATFDSDGDGLPDWWERKYFGSLNVTNNPNGDSDGDGVSDGDEYKQGRNPNAGTVTNSNLELIIFTPTQN